MNDRLHKEILDKMLDNWSTTYIVIETKYTIHHIEKLLSTCKDRGCFKWIAETKPEAFVRMDKGDDEAVNSHVDNGDLFPRMYFLKESISNELFAWLKARGLPITEIKAPKI